MTEVLDAVLKTKGDPQRGRQLFTELSCVACHTVKADEPRKGPFLGPIADTYRRRELAEQILAPSKIIAKGFETNLFALKNGEQVQGFVVAEDPKTIVIRTITAQEVKIPVADVEERGKSGKSLMPDGLVSNLTVGDFAALLDFLQSLATPKTVEPKLTRPSE